MSSNPLAKPCCTNCKKELPDVAFKFCGFCGAQVVKEAPGNSATDEKISEKTTSSLEEEAVKESKISMQATSAPTPSGSWELNSTQATVLPVNGNDSRTRSASVLYPQTADLALDKGETEESWVQVDEHRRKSIRRDERDVRSKSTGFISSIKSKSHCDVVFHVLVPKYAWTVKSNSFSIFMKFDSQKLGGWKKEHSDFRIIRETNEFIELEANQLFESDLLSKGVAYLYGIHGSPYESEEFIYSYPQHLSGRFLRYLKISKKREHHQYDSMIFPSGDVRIERKSVKAYIKENPKGDRQIFIPSFEAMQSESLEIFLIDFISNLSKLKCDRVMEVTDLIMNVFICLSCPQFKLLSDGMKYQKKSMELCKAMSDSLIIIMSNLSTVEDPALNGMRIVSVVIVICCYNRLFKLSNMTMKDIPDYYTANLLSMLRFQPDLESLKCHDWDILSKCISKQYRVEARDGILQFFSHLLHLKLFSKLDWLYAVPLLHFLSKETKPFSSFQYTPNQIPWESKLIDSATVKQLRDTEKCGLEKDFDRISSLLVLDPLLLYMIVNICPTEVFRNFLILKIPPYISMSFLAAQWKTKEVTMEEAEGIALDLSNISLILMKYKEENSQLLKATFKASEMLLCNTLAKLRGVQEHLTLITKAILLYLQSAKIMQVIDSEEIKPSLKEVQSSLEKYIDRSIGKPFASRSGSWFEKKTENEINIWNAMLCAYVEEDVIRKSWHNLLMKIIKQRVNKVTIERRIELFVSLDKMSQCHKIILDIFITAVIEKIKHVSPAHMERLISVSTQQQHNVGKIIDKILEEHCPNRSFHITLDDLLDWDIWQTLVKIFTNEVVKKRGNPNYVTFLSSTCEGACVYAQSFLNDECNKIKNGCITAENLKKIKLKIQNFEKLLRANFLDEMECEGVMKVLHHRLVEYKVFCAKINILGQLCQNIKDVKVRDLMKLVEEVNRDYSEASIKDLCRVSENRVELICVHSGKLVLEVASQFDVLHSQFPSDLFSKLWREQLIHVKSEITIQEIEGKLWEPTLINCKKLLDSLYEKTITLADVDHYMKLLDNRAIQIKRLCDGVEHLAHSSRQSDYKWIDTVIVLMKEYWSLLDLEKAAKVVLDLRKKLELTGDFTLITKLANRAYFSKENMRLCSISQEYFEAGDFLKNFREDRGKLQCLQSFTDCLDVVWWIRNETQDINSLHKFVSVALYTSAEGAYSNDKLARLKTVSSGYGPLIFDLQKNRTLDAFKVCCSKVWEAFEQNPDLPMNLKYCNADLEWLKMVKGKQASVEVTSYDEMKNIVKYGCYKIGTQIVGVNAASMSLKDVIKLSLNDEKCSTQKCYSLDELRDLESKLILVTGSMANHREQVDNFVKILNYVCRIGEVLIFLREAGNVKYSEWTLAIPSNNSEDLINDLQALAQTMERDLESWKRVVYSARKRFYELNYYTTVQLLVLRRELSAFKDAKSEADVSFEVLALLQSVSCQVSSIFPCLQTCLSETHYGDGHTSRSGDLGDIIEAELANPASRVSNMIKSSSQERFGEVATRTLDDHVSPIPTLTEAQLTKEQSEIMGFIQRQIGCQQNLVLKAFEECHEKDMTRYDYLSWCNDHLEDYHALSDNMDEAVLTDSDMSDSDSERISEDNFIVSPDVVVEGDWTSTVDAKWSDQDNQLQDRGSREEFSRHDARKVQYQGALKIHSDFQAEKKYLTLDKLGKALNFLSGKCPGAVVQKRVFSKYLKIGSPNLLVVSPDHVFRCILCLYMEYLSQESSFGATPIAHPLPTPEEVLICSTSTTAEEIEVFWMRAVNDPGHRRIFVLVHADKLSYQVGDSALRSLQKHCSEKQNYRLVIICSTEGEEKSHFISKLCQYRRVFALHDEIHVYQSYLASHFTVKPKNDEHPPASIVDFANSRVRVVSSDRSGMGKSLYIQQMAQKLQLFSKESRPCCVTIPLHGPIVTADTVLKLLKELVREEQEPNFCIYHFDIAHNVFWQVDTILFCMLILRGLCDSQGRVWRCHSNQLCAIEVTMPNLTFSQGSNLMQLLPAVSCLSPRQVIKYLSTRKPDECIDNKIRLYDKDELSNDSYQRVCQYIQLHDSGGNLEKFTYGKSPAKKIDSLDSLKLILRYCGISDPSWSELYHFVKFLNIQLSSCEQSVYLKPGLMKDFLDGMKGFIVKFMIRMSRDFATSSLNGEVALETESRTEEIEHLKRYEINERKRWEKSPHPYIIFNNDGETFTFVGFNVNIYGNLIDPVSNTIIERSIMTDKLWKELKSNNVDFNDDFQGWTKLVMIEKICTVIGVENPNDPDDSYVLTVDNVTKILAIQMRFRCGIPVVIMGETGCGKTRLIRYMCDLAKLGLDIKNLMILKVHGGTTEQDIIEFVQKAESIKKEAQKKLDDKIETAKKAFEKTLEKLKSEEKKEKLKKSFEQDELKLSRARKQLSNLDIVVFFDEANTTDAINLIKEVMCDRRLNGNPVSHDLKFIAACNPYRK